MGVVRVAGKPAARGVDIRAGEEQNAWKSGACEQMKTITALRALLSGFAIAASAIPTAAYSDAATARFNFGGAPLPSGSFNPGSTFAQLSITPAGFNVFNFTAVSRDLDRLFTGGAFIGAIAID